MIPGVAVCGVVVGIGGGIGVASNRNGFFLYAGCKGGGSDIAAGACGPVGGTGGEKLENSVSVIVEGGCGAGCGAEKTPPGNSRGACILWMTAFKPLSILSASCIIPQIVRGSSVYRGLGFLSSSS